MDNQQDWATNVPLPSSASATRKPELLKIASVAIITTVMAILPNSTITVVRISVYHQPQVWWPLLKSEPYFLNCPRFYLLGVIPPNSISNFKLFFCTKSTQGGLIKYENKLTHWLSLHVWLCGQWPLATQSLPFQKGHQIFLLLIAEIV